MQSCSYYLRITKKMVNYKDFTKLNIGCGKKKIEDAWNIDKISSVNPDETYDITCGGFYYDKDSFEEIIADYVLTQFPQANSYLFLLLMNDLHRILKPNGTLKIKVGNAAYSAAFNDPMDCRFFTKETFDYFNYEHYRYKVFDYGFLPWKIIKIEEISGGNTPDIKDRLSVWMTPIK